MMRKRNSDPLFAAEGMNEKRERKMTEDCDSVDERITKMETKSGNGQSGEDEEMINVVDVSDNEERMDSAECMEIQNSNAPSVTSELFASASSTASSASSAALSLPLDLSKKKRRLTASTSLTEDNDQREEDGDNCGNDQRQRKGIAGFSGIRGGSFGAGTGSSSSSSSSSTIKWRRPPLECETPSRGQSPSVIVGGVSDMASSLPLQQHAFLGRNVSDAWQFLNQQTRPSVIRSADFSFEPPESTDVDEHFRKSLSGGGQVTTEADAKVDDHFVRALGDVWWALKNRMHLTSTGDEGSGQRSSPSPASIQSSTVSNYAAALNSSSARVDSSSSPPISNSSPLPQSSIELPSKPNISITFPSSTPLKKRILSKAAAEVEAAAQRLELANNNNNNGGNREGEFFDRQNNNSHSDEDSRKSLSAPNTPPPTPL